jgi:thymidine kinase
MSPSSISGGHIEVITGTMFSGKTEELIRRLERSEIAGQKVQVFKPEIDDRYSEETVCSHRGSEWESEIIPTSESYNEIMEKVGEADVVAIDEANFFQEGLIRAVQDLADEGYRVIVVGLDQTYRGETFKPMGRLMAIAEYVEKFQAICEKCGEPATRPQRLIDGEPAHVDEPTVEVGGDEKYEARCRNCHDVRRQ